MTVLRSLVTRGGLIIVTGRPGSGKSAAALTAAGDSCRADGIIDPVGQVRKGNAVVFDEVLDSGAAGAATWLALDGRTVIAVVAAGDVLEALDWFTELATRDDATELGVYTALTAVIRIGGDPDVFENTPAATRALLEGRPAAEVRAAGTGQ
ncbi:hypothetical protein ACWGJ9_08675 [Curtobacterium citreum]